MTALRIDNTYGSGMLTAIGNTKYSELDQAEKIQYLLMIEDFRQKVKSGDDWLTNLLCQYHRPHIDTGDAIWYSRIKDMIINGTLYMALFPVEKYACADKFEAENVKNLTDSMPCINIDTVNSKNSDGIFTINGPVSFLKLYPTDEETPEDPEEIIVNDITGTIEFGTTHICKTAMSLMNNSPLLRVPYPNTLPPYAVIFFNTKPLELFKKD